MIWHLANESDQQILNFFSCMPFNWAYYRPFWHIRFMHYGKSMELRCILISSTVSLLAVKFDNGSWFLKLSIAMLTISECLAMGFTFGFW